MNKNAFTLVELIVVIIILAILWTIAFVSFQNYTDNSRDWVRKSDIANLMNSLELYKSKTWEYPNPDSSSVVYYQTSSNVVWTQWTVWIETTKKLYNLDKVPRDPLTWNEYTYSVLNTKEEYQVAAALEKWYVSMNISNDKRPVSVETGLGKLLTQANAASNISWTAYIKWTYNWQIAKVKSWSTTYVLAVPTIINWDMSLTDIVEILNKKKLVYNWYSNLPASYSWTSFIMDWWFDYSQTGWLVVYSWSIEDLKTDKNKRLELTKELKDYYSTTVISNDSNFKKLLETNINLLTPSEDAKLLADSIVENNLDEYIKDNYNLWEVAIAAIAPPTVPVWLNSQFQTDTAFEVSWDTATWATQYWLYLSWNLVKYVSETSSIINWLNPNTDYNFYITAKNSISETSPSNQITVKTAPPPPTINTYASNESEIGIWWNSVPWATSYNIYKNWAYFNTTTATWIVLNSLVPNTDYNITVSSNKWPYTTSSQSSNIIFSTAPKVPTNFQATHVSNDSISFSRDPSPWATKYKFYIWDYPSLNLLWSGSTYFQGFDFIEPLPANTTLYYGITALKSDTQQSNYTYFSKQTAPTSLTPSDITGLQIISTWSTEVNLKIDKLPSASKYYLYAGWFFIWETDDNNETDLKIYNLTPNTYYDDIFRVVWVKTPGSFWNIL